MFLHTRFHVFIPLWKSSWRLSALWLSTAQTSSSWSGPPRTSRASARDTCIFPAREAEKKGQVSYTRNWSAHINTEISFIYMKGANGGRSNRARKKKKTHRMQTKLKTKSWILIIFCKNEHWLYFFILSPSRLKTLTTLILWNVSWLAWRS